MQLLLGVADSSPIPCFIMGAARRSTFITLKYCDEVSSAFMHTPPSPEQYVSGVLEI